MLNFSALERWLGQQIVPVLYIGFAMLMGLAIVYISAQSRQAALARKRSGLTEDTFAEFLAAYGFDPQIAQLTYRYLRNVQKVPFPVDPRDDLDRDLGLDGEDVEQSVRDLLDATGREYLPGLLESPLITVVDLVRHIQASPRREPDARQRIA
jgi:hypothetical protein